MGGANENNKGNRLTTFRKTCNAKSAALARNRKLSEKIGSSRSPNFDWTSHSAAIGGQKRPIFRFVGFFAFSPARGGRTERRTEARDTAFCRAGRGESDGVRHDAFA